MFNEFSNVAECSENEKYINDTDYNIPPFCGNRLGFRPDFRPPPLILNNDFMENIYLTLDKCIYKMFCSKFYSNAISNN